MARSPKDSESTSKLINEGNVIPPSDKKLFTEKPVLGFPEIPNPEFIHSDVSSKLKNDKVEITKGTLSPAQPIAYVAMEEELLEESLPEAEFVDESVKMVAQENIDKFNAFKDKVKQISVIVKDQDLLEKDHDVTVECSTNLVVK